MVGPTQFNTFCQCRNWHFLPKIKMEDGIFLSSITHVMWPYSLKMIGWNIIWLLNGNDWPRYCKSAMILDSKMIMIDHGQLVAKNIFKEGLLAMIGHKTAMILDCRWPWSIIDRSWSIHCQRTVIPDLPLAMIGCEKAMNLTWSVHGQITATKWPQNDHDRSW